MKESIRQRLLPALLLSSLFVYILLDNFLSARQDPMPNIRRPSLLLCVLSTRPRLSAKPTIAESNQVDLPAFPLSSKIDISRQLLFRMLLGRESALSTLRAISWPIHRFRSLDASFSSWMKTWGRPCSIGLHVKYNAGWLGVPSGPSTE